jgi:hypothetical protein
VDSECDFDFDGDEVDNTNGDADSKANSAAVGGNEEVSTGGNEAAFETVTAATVHGNRADESLPAKKRKLKRKFIQQTPEQKAARMFGPFDSPFSHNVHLRIKRKLYPQPVPYNVFKGPNLRDGDRFCLEIGDHIQCMKFGDYLQQRFQIVDFGAPNKIFSGPFAEDVKIIDDDCIKITRTREKKDTEYNVPAGLLVKRNPKRSRKMVATELIERDKKWHKIQEGLKKQDDFQAGGVVARACVRTPREIIGDSDQEQDPDWRSLLELPADAKEDRQYPRQQEDLEGTESRKCFICKAQVYPDHTMDEWTKVGQDYYGGTRTAGRHSLTRHCDEKHKADMFWFLPRHRIEASSAYPWSIRCHLQKILLSSMKDGHMQYDLFYQALIDGNPEPLKAEFEFRFGKMDDAYTSAHDMKKTIAGKEYKPSTCAYFLETVAVELKRIRQAFYDFDFRFLIIEKAATLGDVYKIWNATNLFLCRGLFNKPDFPVIEHLNVKNLTMEEALRLEDEVNGVVVNALGENPCPEPTKKRYRGPGHARKRRLPLADSTGLTAKAGSEAESGSNKYGPLYGEV